MVQTLMVQQGASLNFYHRRGEGHIGGACRESLARHAENLIEICNGYTSGFPPSTPPPKEKKLLKPEEVKSHHKRQVSFSTIWNETTHKAICLYTHYTSLHIAKTSSLSSGRAKECYFNLCQRIPPLSMRILSHSSHCTHLQAAVRPLGGAASKSLSLLTCLIQPFLGAQRCFNHISYIIKCNEVFQRRGTPPDFPFGRKNFLLQQPTEMLLQLD